jgi:hypothetical protein
MIIPSSSSSANTGTTINEHNIIIDKSSENIFTIFMYKSRDALLVSLSSPFFFEMLLCAGDVADLTFTYVDATKDLTLT